VYHLPELNQLIVGDLVNVLTISAPTVSLKNWLAQLHRIKAQTSKDTLLHVGHGPSGPAHSLIDDQMTYLQLLNQYVTHALSDGNGVSAQETEQIVYDMRLAYPHHQGAAFMPPERLLALSVGWVAQQLQSGR
jgi:glyoxylase-like metal-dependent hydrolase (beta-lactamase superfamily II)